VSAEGVAPLKKKVDALLEHPLPLLRLLRTHAARPGFYPYQAHSTASTGDQQAAPAGKMGIHQAWRGAAAAHAAVRQPIRGCGSRCEDLRGDGGRTAVAGLCGPAQAAHRPGAGDGGPPRPLGAAAEGAGRSGCRNA
jgi:hypothetical protein